MRERTSHGERRMQDADRPSAYAQQDRLHPDEVYIDTATGYLIYVGPNGRTHVFTADGQYHTSFIITRRNRLSRITSTAWQKFITSN